MSLKERLNQETKKEFKLEKKEPNLIIKEEKPINQKTLEANTLGVIDALLFDSDINSIFINGFNSIYLERNAKTYQSSVTYKDEDEFKNIIKNLAYNFNLDIKDAPIDIPLKKGVNIKATLPPLSTKPTMAIKCYKDNLATFEELLSDDALSKEMALVFETLSFLKQNIIIAGRKNTAKTTLLSAMAKKILPNQKGVIIDYKNEIGYDSANCANFDLSKTEDKSLIDLIFSINPDKVFLNDPKNDIKYYLEELLNGFKGITLTLEAKSAKDAVEKITEEILKLKPHLSYQEASKITSELFNLIVFVDRDEDNSRKITFLGETKENLEFETIFFVNESKDFSSNGVVPKFLEEESEHAHLIGANIFDTNYRHTKQIKVQNKLEAKKNIDLLEKFKKKPNDDEFFADTLDEDLESSLDESLLDDEQNL